MLIAKAMANEDQIVMQKYHRARAKINKKMMAVTSNDSSSETANITLYILVFLDLVLKIV